MTHEINEADFMSDIELSPDFKETIAEVFSEAVASQVDETLELIDALNDAAEWFADFVNENGITEDELDEAFAFFVEKFGIDEDYAELLAAFISESFTVEGDDQGEYYDDDELEEANRAGHGTAKHLGSWTLADKNVVHCWDRGQSFHTNKRYIIKKHSPAGLHLSTHTAGTKDELDATLNALNGKKPVKEAAEPGSLMERYVNGIEKQRFMS
jgi:hypothetical protein